jgi:hypothetical protein
MKVTGKHVLTSVGVFFIVFALIAAVIVSARDLIYFREGDGPRSIHQLF